MSRVAITGIGVIAPGAVGIDAFRTLLNSGRTGIGEIDRFDTAGLGAHKAALVLNFTPKDFISPMKMRRMNALSRFGVAAAKLAAEDRGGAAFPAGMGVAIGTSFGPVQTSVDYMKEYVEKGAALAPPQLFAESVANAPGSHIAIENGLRGFNVTVTQRESSALAAAMYAATQVAKGNVPGALIGGVEEVNEMIFSVLDRVGALAHANGTVDEQSRPFDRRRNGIVLGEGSFVAAIEAEPARQPYAYIAGFGIARDTTATISDWGTGHEAVVKAMRAAISDADIELSMVDAIYGSGNGGKPADRLEYRAISALFGDRVPPVVATKGYFGEYAAGGGLQIASAALAMYDQNLHASAGFESGDDEMQIEINRQARGTALDHILVNSLSAGGGIVSMVLAREGE
ncbi:MAG TPA: beta-ketoacyl synthase N-terminal-like domain-containing protein [Thermoanaerobaculia bacterium]|nr:beta-ketoacyl synthase N-terminal-like domain-containing protein [Thermoanaerobaculia bacterium]